MIESKAKCINRSDIHKMLDLVLDINGTGERQQEKTGNLPTAFFNFSGHTGGVEIQICKSGWVEGEFPKNRMLSFTWDTDGFRRNVRELERLAHELTKGEEKKDE